MIFHLIPPGCGALFLLRATGGACKKQTAAPAPLRLFLPQAAPQLRSPSARRCSPAAAPPPPYGGSEPQTAPSPAAPHGGFVAGRFAALPGDDLYPPTRPFSGVPLSLRDIPLRGTGGELLLLLLAMQQLQGPRLTSAAQLPEKGNSQWARAPFPLLAMPQ